MQWLFLVHQVRTPNSRERVRVWRLTKKAGALLYRNSVYVLPYGKERLEDFQWLCQQIRDSLGEASVFISESTDERESQALLGLFKKARESDYNLLIDSAEKLSARIRGAGEEKRLPGDALKSLAKEVADLEEAFLETERIDFFGHPLKKKAKSAMEGARKELDSAVPSGLSGAPLKPGARKSYRGKTWATRKQIHIDRLCSAWLIRRFIDPKAKFVFAPESALPGNAIPFDVFGAEFSHHGEDCTFETLLKSFRIKDRALDSLAQIVHDIDMKDGKFSRPEAAGLDAVVRSLSDSIRDDHKVLRLGSEILDALYSRFANRKAAK
jgi:hypothetical protein